MTGFGAAEGPVAGGRLGVEIRTVNHRFFNFAPRLPNDLTALEGEVRERLRKEFERGHVALTIRWLETAPRDPQLVVNVERAQTVAARLRELQQAVGITGDVTLELIARQPDVLTQAVPPAQEVPFAALEPIVAAAAVECRRMRAREGAVLATELLGRLASIGRATDAVEVAAPGRLVRERDRLREAVRELTDGRAIDETRLATEIALLADRLDITEELVRLRAHLAACRDALTDDRAVGKELGFLAQELGREINTIGSKANDAAITQQVIAMKGEMEKIREQLENLE